MRDFFKKKLLVSFLVLSVTLSFVPTRVAHAGDVVNFFSGGALNLITNMISGNSVLLVSGLLDPLGTLGQCNLGWGFCRTDGRVTILPSVSSVSAGTSCGYKIPVTFYNPNMNLSYYQASGPQTVCEFDYCYTIPASDPVPDPSFNETNRQVAIYRFSIPISTSQAAMSNWFIYDISASSGNGWEGPPEPYSPIYIMNWSPLGPTPVAYAATDGNNYWWARSESSPIKIAAYSDLCSGNVCKFDDYNAPDNSYVVYVAKILGDYSYPSYSENGISLSTGSNKFLNNNNTAYAEFPLQTGQNLGNTIVGPYQTGVPVCPTCTNGANNYPTCNTCTSPQVMSGGVCVTPGASCTSSSNDCGGTSGTYNASGVCVPPANPSGYGSACTSAANGCGLKNTGVIGCDGITCSVSAPALPANYGTPCTSDANSCGMKNTGTYGCNNSCSVPAPSDASCATLDPYLSATPLVQGTSCSWGFCSSVLRSTLTAGTSGTASGPVTYTFLCDNANTGWWAQQSFTKSPSPAGAQDTQTASCSYWLNTTSVTASVLVNRGGLSVLKTLVLSTVDACGSASGTTPTNVEPIGAGACAMGTLNPTTPADTALAWKWSCGSVNTCSAPKFGCTATTDTNYNASGPSNTYGCALTCKNSATNYPTCTTCTSTPNACGGTNGTIDSAGACVPPANPSGYGSACESAANACGKTNSGTKGCDGITCSVTSAPSESGCACTAPLAKDVHVACDANASGVAATSGDVIRHQLKSDYPACTFPASITTSNSTYVSDTCVYPAPVNGACGTANGETYSYTSSSYSPKTQCAKGSPSSTAFPSAGSSASWTCSGTNGGSASDPCSASRDSSVGTPCTSTPNSCEETNGTYDASGACIPPADPAGYGSACESAANVCGLKNTGITVCDGCDAGTPSDNTCPPTIPTISALWQGDKNVGTTGSAYSPTGYTVLAKATSPTGGNVIYYFEWSGDSAAPEWSSWVGSGGWGNVVHYANYPAGTYYARAWSYYEYNGNGNWSISPSDWLKITLSPEDLSVSCVGTPGNPYIGQPVTWSSSVSGGSRSYSYSWSGDENLSGTTASVQKTYTTSGSKNATLAVTDTRSGQTGSAVCTHGANQPNGPICTTPPCTPTPPTTPVEVGSCTATLTPSSYSIEQGEPVTLSWNVTGGSLCATSCYSGNGDDKGGFSTGGAISGNGAQVTVAPTPPNASYALTCTGGTYGPTPPTNTTVAVLVPTVNLTVNGQTGTARVNQGTANNVTVAWSSDKASSCTITKSPSSTGWPKSGISNSGITESVTAQTVYKADCVNNHNTHATASVTVNVLASFQEF